MLALITRSIIKSDAVRSCLRFTHRSNCASQTTHPSIDPADSFQSDQIKSLLYIPNDLANKTVSVLKPAVTLDNFIENPGQITEMHDNLAARGLPDVDISGLLDDWVSLKKVRKEVDDKNAMAALSRPEQKELSRKCSRLEKILMPIILKLPNRLNHRTRSTIDVVHLSDRQNPEFDFAAADHKTLGHNTGTIVFKPEIGPNAYYFKGSMAWLELATLDFFRRRFQNQTEDYKFTQFSNPDFSKSIVLESCDLDFTDPNLTFHLERGEDANPYLPVDLHLTGSASMDAFCAYHAKTSVRYTTLPLRYYAAGQLYKPRNVQSNQDGLFGVSQEPTMSFFVATGQETPGDKSHDDMLTFLKNSFDELDVHYRVLKISAVNLLRSESLRSEVQLWSPVDHEYHTVASVSVCDDFISRRLLMLYSTSRTKTNFLNICKGNAISIPPFLACIIENNQTRDGYFTIPTPLQKCIDRLKSETYS